MTEDTKADRLIVYVDGFNLYHGLRNESHREHLWLDVVALAKELRPRSQIVRVYYFTAPVLDDPDARSRQAHYIHAMQARNPRTLEVVMGRYQRKEKNCVSCGASYTSYEEKETDVNIAVRLVADAARGLMDTALIISADSDMAPAVRMVQAIAPQLTVIAAFPPRRRSFELMHLMPRSFHIGMNKVRRSQMPDHFSAEGSHFTRPSQWTKDPTWTSRPERRRRKK